MRASPALFNRFRAEHVNPSIEATKHPRKVQELSSTIVAMVSTVRVPGRGMASTSTIQAGVGRLRLGVAVTAHPGLYGVGARPGLASPIADNRLDQSRGWKAELHRLSSVLT